MFHTQAERPSSVIQLMVSESPVIPQSGVHRSAHLGVAGREGFEHLQVNSDEAILRNLNRLDLNRLVEEDATATNMNE